MCKPYKDNAFKDRFDSLPVPTRRQFQPERYCEVSTELALDPQYNGEDNPWQSGEWFGEWFGTDFDISPEGVWTVAPDECTEDEKDGSP